MENYEDDRFIYTVVRTNTQGSPCAPFFSITTKPGVVERTGRENTEKRQALYAKLRNPLFPDWEDWNVSALQNWAQKLDPETGKAFIRGYGVTNPRVVVDILNLWLVKDDGSIDKAIDELFAANADKVAQAKVKPAVAGWFVGQVMKVVGKSDPKVIKTKIEERLAA